MPVSRQTFVDLAMMNIIVAVYSGLTMMNRAEPRGIKMRTRMQMGQMFSLRSRRSVILLPNAEYRAS